MQLLPIFQSFRTILCVCPYCGRIHRLSDPRLKYKRVTPKTWLDEYEVKLRRLEKRGGEIWGERTRNSWGSRRKRTPTGS